MITLDDIYFMVTDYINEQPIDDEDDLVNIMDEVGDRVSMACCDFANDNDMDFNPTF